MNISAAWQRTAFLYSGTGLTIITVICIALRLSWTQFERPRHIDEISRDYGSTSLFLGVPQLSHKGNQFTFVKTKAKGYALYLCDADTGQIQMLQQANNYLGKYGNESHLKALPWSPDDSLFLYTLRDVLMGYSLLEHKSSVLATNGAASISDLVWISPSEFVSVACGTNLYYFQKQTKGRWEGHFRLACSDQMSSLNVISDDAVAWLEGGSVCRASLSGDSKVGAPITDTILDINASLPSTNGLLVWLDTSILSQSDNSSVDRLLDLSQNHNDAFSIGAPPTFNQQSSTNALNGRGTIHFTSSDSITNGLEINPITSLVGSAPRSVFVVMRRNGTNSMMVNMGSTGKKGSLFAVGWEKRLYLPEGWRANNNIRTTFSNWNILEAIYDAGNEKGYVNGVLQGVATNDLDTSKKEIEIGLRTATRGKNAEGGNGDFAELLIYNHALSAAERMQVENYLLGKWFPTGFAKSSKVKVKNRGLAYNPYLWFVPNVDGLTNFTYSTQTGEFLFNCSEMQYGSLWKYNPTTYELTKITEGAPIRDEQWFGFGQFGYYLDDLNNGGIAIKDSITSKVNIALRGADVSWFRTIGTYGDLLILGTISNTPATGIWLYNSTSQQAKPLVACSEEPSVYATRVVPTNIVIQIGPQERLDCTVYTPLNFNSHKRYPLVLGDTVFTDPIYRYQGPDWAPAIASCGGYVVIVERKGWFNGLQDWGPNIRDAYKELEKKLPIDTSQIYLFGSSAETQELSNFVAVSPRLWKGLILLNPTTLPQFTESPRFQSRPKVLISAGANENEDGRLERYQRDSLDSGVIVECVIHPGEGHHLVGDAARVVRTQAIMHFIFEE